MPTCGMRRETRVSGEMLAVVLRHPAARQILDELDLVPVGILRVEGEGPALAFRGVVRDGHALGLQIEAHGLGIIGLERDLHQPVGVRGLLREELNELVVVDLDPGEMKAAVGMVEREGFVESEELLVESAGLRDVVHVERHVGDPDQVRAGGGGLLGPKEGGRAGEQRKGGGEKRVGFHQRSVLGEGARFLGGFGSPATGAEGGGRVQASGVT